MPPSRKKQALQTIDHNAQAPLAEPTTTPCKQVKELQAQLEKQQAENKTLQATVANLAKAVGGMKLAAEAIKNEDASTIVTTTDNATAIVEEGENIKSKTTRAKKDKDAPVPAKTAYKYFCEDNKPAKEEENTDMRNVWKEASPEIRAKYQAMADADKIRFQTQDAKYQEEKKALELYHRKKKEEAAMHLYEATLTAQAALAQAQAGKKPKKLKDPEAPKRPTSSYMYFANEHRAAVKGSHAEASVTEISKILGEKWNALVKGKRGKNGTQKYDDMAAKDKVRYEEEKAIYDAQMAERKVVLEKEAAERKQAEKEEALKLLRSVQADAASAIITASTVTQPDEISAMTENSTKKPIATKEKAPAKKKKDPNAPKRAMSAYLYFCQKKRTEIKASMPETTTNAELLSAVGRRWKELPEAEKAPYNALAATDKERFAKEMQTYKPPTSTEALTNSK